MAYTAHTFNQLFNFIWRDREYRRHDVLSSWINGISQSQTSFSGNSQSLTSFSGNSSPESHPFWRKEQTCLFYPIVASVGFSCRTLQRMHVRGLVHSYTFLFDPSIASDWRTSNAPFWTDMCCRLKCHRCEDTAFWKHVIKSAPSVASDLHSLKAACSRGLSFYKLSNNVLFFHDYRCLTHNVYTC